MPRIIPAFTLIELLVVITIIVVLLALLAPALDRAIYEAELAMCGANQKVIASGVAMYGMDHQRRYPYRRGVIDVGWNAKMLTLGATHSNAASGNQGQSIDDRPMIAPYLNISGVFNDPLGDRVDLETQDRDTTVSSSYFLGFGWSWQRGHAGETGMFKIGDAYTYSDNAAFYSPKRRFKFRIVSQDYDFFSPDFVSTTSHPDADGVLHFVKFEDEHLNEGHTNAALRGLEMVQGKQTRGQWMSDLGNPTHNRGLIDTNHAYDDGSVRRITDLDAVRFPTEDPRITFVPQNNASLSNANQVRVPSR